MKVKWNWNRRAFRLVCPDCGVTTQWFNKKRVLEAEETVESWTQWWTDLHMEVTHDRV